MMRSVAIVGASLAGLSAARALREQGFDGRVTLIGDETHRPYDRPPLSKDFLLGKATLEDLDLGDEDDAGLDLDWRLGHRAAALLPAERSVLLEDGSEVTADGVICATGARARALPLAHAMDGVHTLRTLDDAVALRETLLEGGPLVVIGAGFIGAEVASTARSLGTDVTVVEAAPVPLAGPLGTDMGTTCAGLHADHGVRLVTGTPVRELVGETRVEGVRLADDTVLPAAAVVVGIGAEPNTEWLVGSGVTVDGGVLTDAGCGTGVPGVVAVGDCAAAFSPHAGRHVRVEHWTHALERPAAAVRTLLAGGEVTETAETLPYFWSEQYGVRIQFAGERAPEDTVRIVAGDPEDRSFVALYERDGAPTAVLGMNQPKQFTRWRRQIAKDRRVSTVG